MLHNIILINIAYKLYIRHSYFLIHLSHHPSITPPGGGVLSIDVYKCTRSRCNLEVYGIPKCRDPRARPLHQQGHSTQWGRSNTFFVLQLLLFLRQSLSQLSIFLLGLYPSILFLTFLIT